MRPGRWAVGTRGTKAECLAQIEQVWTDMRPRSMRRTTPGGGCQELV
jgi:MbtH protein